MSAALQLTQDAFRSHLALEVLDRTLDAFVADLDLERPALNRFAGVRQGVVDMTDPSGLGKTRSADQNPFFIEFSAWKLASDPPQSRHRMAPASSKSPGPTGLR
jgi:hypothetical protein